jgi:nucleoside-diphosphate-sugar epimerase
LHYKDAARAMIQLEQAPVDRIKTLNYLVDGVKPTPTAAQLADIVRHRIAGAQITFAPDTTLPWRLERGMPPLDDSRARTEWDWQPTYDLAPMVDDFLPN